MFRLYGEEEPHRGGMNIRSRATYGLAASLFLLAAAGAGGSTAPKPPSWVIHGKYSPVIDPANFVSKIDNRYFPLLPGTAFHYRGTKEGTRQSDVMTVTHKVKHILGVSCTVVRDIVYQDGKPLERTLDWYAQDKQGNVWYMGEAAFDRKNGRFVRASDSWESGV